jgi:DNA-binding CsgD family transcriptional regulator
MALIAPGRKSPRLSPRQKRLLELLCDGHQYKTAAAAMGVTVNTVSFHVRRMYVRLGVHSKSEAVAKAFREDLLGWDTT